jgi:prepilin-type N-terminal cleavage/methylation domain-containing protein
MSTPAASHRAGMTLVELLVVVLILGLLSVAVLPNLTGTKEGRRFREAARGISSFIARAQSRAISAPAPRGFTIKALPGAPAAGIDFLMANSPPPYGGASLTSRAWVRARDGFPTEVQFLGPAGPEPLDGSFVKGDAIQFGGHGPYFKFLPPNEIAMWTEINQNLGNSAWPRTPPGGVPFRILRQPRQASGGTFQAQQGAAIDLRWSCLGPQTFFERDIVPASDQPVQPITFLFDVGGRPLEIVHSGGTRTRVTEPIFLLVGAAELAGNAPSPQATANPDSLAGATWQHADSVWLAIDHHTGVVKHGPVTPNARNVLESQWFVRQTVGQGTSER